MTTEDDFQKRLDEEPNDHQTRLVFADWLQERGDPRAEGYRLLGVGRFVPYLYQPPACVWWPCLDDAVAGVPRQLPVVWEHRVAGGTHVVRGYYRGFATRRDAEDQAALALPRLSPLERAILDELLERPTRKGGEE